MQDIEIVTLLGHGDFRRNWLAAILLYADEPQAGASRQVSPTSRCSKVARGLHAAGNPARALAAGSACLDSMRALGLPPACFELVPVDWHVLDDYKFQHARRAFDNLSSMIWVRHQMRRTLAP